MKCRQFMIAVEDYLGVHPASPSILPAALAAHVERCRRCERKWRRAAGSRLLLTELRPASEPPADPTFVTRVHARIRAQQAAHHGWRGMRVAGRDVVIAMVLFASALGSFLYNLQRIEQPNVSEAMVLDVPHINPEHPADSHRRPQPADVMLNLMNP